MARHAKTMGARQRDEVRDSLKETPAVVVVWEDHNNPYPAGWIGREEVVELAKNIPTMISVGFIIDETPKYYLLAGTLTEDDQINEPMEILKSCVLLCQPLKLSPSVTRLRADRPARANKKQEQPL